MFDFLKSLFGAKDEEILEKVASIKATEGASINKTNNLTKEIDVNKAGEPLFKNKKDGKYGFVNAKGEQVVECKFDYIYDFKDGLAAVEKDRKYGFINTKGEQVIECKFDDAKDFSEGLARVKKDGKWGYINAKGEQVIECKFDWISDFSEGLARVKKDGKWGFINTKGEQVIECKFGYAHNFKKGLAEVMQDGQWVVINTKGNFIVFDEDNNQIEVIKEVSDKSGNVFLLSNSDGKFGLLDANYNVLIKNKLYGEFEVVQRMNENTFLIKMAEKEFFIDSNGDFK